MAEPTQANVLAGKLAQLLAETQITAAPHVAKVHHDEHFRQVEQFLEGLEAHTSEKIGPFLTELFDGVEIPETLKPMIADVIGPEAQFSAILTQVFLYGIVSSLISTSTQPFLQGVLNAIWTKAVEANVSVPVAPAVLATAAGRGLKLGDEPTVSVPAESYAEAAKSGVSKEDLNLQASLVGLPPAFQELLEMRRRDIITDAELTTGLQEGDFRDDWIAKAVQLIHGWLTPLDFVRAAVQSQMSYADAADWAQKTGLDTTTALPLETAGTEATPDMFGLAFSIAGRPPGPQELAQAANRGIIDWAGTGANETTFEQGIAESDVKTKWTPTLQKLAEYLPPAEAITTLLEKGAITSQQAHDYWTARGVPDELATAYVYTTEQQHISQDKLLAKGEILTAYYDQLMDRTDAETFLGQLGFRGAIADEILDIQDFKRDMQAINAVVRRVNTLYGANKITATNAKTALQAVGLTADKAQQLLDYWGVLRDEPIRLPSVASIGKAVKYGTLTQAEALSELEALGYQPRDAAIELSAESETAITPLPAAGTTITG